MNDTNEQVVLKTVGLTKQYGEFTALDSLDLELHTGQILGYIGPNGAGKTTTMKILVGLLRPTSGQAFIGDIDCTKQTRQLKHLVGYLPDTFGAYDNMRVREYLDFFGAAFKIPRQQRATRIGEVMELTNSTYMQDLYVEALSHGMKQRVGIARTLLHDPKVLILDEPANGLDPAARIEMRLLLLRLAEMGKTLMVSSHILPELARVCNVVAILTDGKMRAFGTLEQIMHRIRQQRLFEVEVLRAEQVEPLAAALTEQLEADAKIEPSSAERQVRFSTTAEDEQVAGLLASAVRHNLGVAKWREVELDLEQAFMEVTTREAT